MKSKIFFWQLAVTILFTLAVAGCGSAKAIPPPSPSPTSTLIPSATPLPEGPVLVKKIGSTYIPGTIYGHGETAILLAGRGGYPPTEWFEFSQVLAEEGYTTLTMASQDSEGVTIQHIGYGIQFLREHGFKKIVCMGASNGASGCAYHAKEPELTGLVLITYHGVADLSEVPYPKLFLGAELDTAYRPVSEREYEKASDPKNIIIVSGASATGPSLLGAPDSNLNQIVLDFIKACNLP